MRKFTVQEIEAGAREFRTRTEDPRQDLVERQLNIGYATESSGGAITVTARVTDRDGKVWEGSARGSEPYATLKSKAFLALEAVIKKADLEAALRFHRDREAGAAAGSRRRRDGLRWVRHVFSFPTGMIAQESGRNVRAGITYGIDLCNGFRQVAEVTDPSGRVWRATGEDRLDVNRAIRALLETAAAEGDAGAKAVLEAIDRRGPPRQRSADSDERGGRG